MTVLAINKWKSNAELIADCAALGYLERDDMVLDPTYGHGTFWKVWQPADLIGTDIDPAKCMWRSSVDFTALPFPDRVFDAVVFDPPYKLNGRPSEFEERYGVHERTRWQDRMLLIELGVYECARVLDGGHLLVKCQDQVVSGRKVWQTDAITQHAHDMGLTKVDRFDFLSYRKQPEGRRQVHAHCCSSQLLVFKRGR